MQTAINSWLRIYSQILTLPSLLFSLTFMSSPCPMQSTRNHILKTTRFKASLSSARLVTNKRQLWQTKNWPSGLEHWLLLLRTGFQFPVLTQWLTTVCNSRARRSDTSSLHLNLPARLDLYTDTWILDGCRQRGRSPDSPKLPSRPPCRLPTAFTAARLRFLLQSRCRQVSLMPTQKECGYICGSKENGALDLLPLSFLLCVPWLIHLGQKITTSSAGKEWIFLARSNARCL